MKHNELIALNNLLLDSVLFLKQTDSGLSLCHPDYTPLKIDFLSQKLQHRMSQNIQAEMVVRACGAKQKPSILDLTAGLGRDAFLLASVGCKVCMFERNPIMHALLEDALWRVKQAQALDLDLLYQDSCVLTNELIEKAGSPDVIYVDPMHPERNKSALVKKEMRILRELVGEDVDRIELIESTFKLNVKKVVVKWPAKQPLPLSKKPTHSLKGKSIRFDVFQLN